MQKSKGIVRGALVLAISAFLSKFLGAVYRIPLTNVIKSEGLGLYQMVFPVYCILLDFAGAGVPSALSKIIAERKELGAEEREKFIKEFLGALREEKTPSIEKI